MPGVLLLQNGDTALVAAVKRCCLQGQWRADATVATLLSAGADVHVADAVSVLRSYGPVITPRSTMGVWYPGW